MLDRCDSRVLHVPAILQGLRIDFNLVGAEGLAELVDGSIKGGLVDIGWE